jgi:hypothetical protein
MKRSQRAQRRSREEWRILVDEWRASGKPMKEFAGERELSANCLSYWSSTLQRERRKPPTPKLLPVRVMASQEFAGPGLELDVGPLRLRFAGGASPAYVAAVARALLTAGSA